MVLDWLSRRRRRPCLEKLAVVMYTRRGCHLCDDAWQQLQARQRRHGFALESVDVDADPELITLYGNEVPVVTVNGTVRFRGGINDVLLDRLLRAAAQSLRH